MLELFCIAHAHSVRLCLDGWGLSLEQTGRPVEACDVYRRAALLDPEDSGIQQRLAFLARFPAP